jgi:hypothetical protein
MKSVGPCIYANVVLLVKSVGPCIYADDVLLVKSVGPCMYGNDVLHTKTKRFRAKQARGLLGVPRRKEDFVRALV